MRKPITESTAHGTNSTYSNYGCRCEPCTKAHAEYSAASRKSVTKADPHGKVRTYDKGCRCATCARAKRDQYMLKLYGVTPAEYDERYAKQGGKCAICQRDYVALRIDHDHATGAVRGLLCVRCNGALGAFEDSLEGIQKAVEYLSK